MSNTFENYSDEKSLKTIKLHQIILTMLCIAILVMVGLLAFSKIKANQVGFLASLSGITFLVNSRYGRLKNEKQKRGL